MASSFAAAAALLWFILTVSTVIALVVRPTSVRVPFKFGQHITSWKIHISHAWVPVIGSIGLVACTSLSFPQVGRAVKGDEHIQPYGILILFMSLAYIAASLDATGMFAWLAHHITKLSKGQGPRLFFLYSALSAVITALTGNDTSIMTITPIIIYFARSTKCDPEPFLVAEFVASNIWSMLLFVGNPTNIIVQQASSMTFIGYTTWTFLPTIVAGGVAQTQLYLTYRKVIPAQLKLPDVNPEALLTDRVGAVFGSINLTACLVLLALAPQLKWDIWVITIVCALLHAIYNLVAVVARDPHTGEWLSSKGVVARLFWTQGGQKKQQVATVPYVASGDDEREADEILNKGFQHSTGCFNLPTPKTSLFQRISSIPSKLYAISRRSTRVGNERGLHHTDSMRSNRSTVDGEGAHDSVAGSPTVHWWKRATGSFRENGSITSQADTHQHNTMEDGLPSMRYSKSLGRFSHGHSIELADHTSQTSSPAHNMPGAAYKSKSMGRPSRKSNLGTVRADISNVHHVTDQTSQQQDTDALPRSMRDSESHILTPRDSETNPPSTSYRDSETNVPFSLRTPRDSDTNTMMSFGTRDSGTNVGVSVRQTQDGMSARTTVDGLADARNVVSIVQSAEPSQHASNTRRNVKSVQFSHIDQAGHNDTADVPDSQSSNQQPHCPPIHSIMKTPAVHRDGSSGMVGAARHEKEDSTGVRALAYPATLSTAAAVNQDQDSLQHDEGSSQHLGHRDSVGEGSGSDCKQTHGKNMGYGNRCKSMPHKPRSRALPFASTNSENGAADGEPAVASGPSALMVATNVELEHVRHALKNRTDANINKPATASSHKQQPRTVRWQEDSSKQHDENLGSTDHPHGFQSQPHTAESGNRVAALRRDRSGRERAASFDILHTYNNIAALRHSHDDSYPKPLPSHKSFNTFENSNIWELDGLLARSKAARDEQQLPNQQQVPIKAVLDGVSYIDVEVGTMTYQGSLPNHQSCELPADLPEELASKRATFWSIILSLPWEVVPFVLGMFVLVEGLKVQGWLDPLTNVLAGKLGPGIMKTGWLSIALCAVLNNQPMTILLTTAVLQPAFTSAINASYGVVDGQLVDAHAAALAEHGRKGILFALVVGSNLGALWTMIGALAGMMWANILRRMGVKMTYTQFMKLMLPLGVTTTVVSLLVLWAEFQIMAPKA